MNSLEAARLTLQEGNYTCVVAKGGKVIFTSRERGVKPLVDCYRQYGQAQEGEDTALADKVIGRAAALLARLMGVRALYARVISQGAMEELNKAGIEAGCETMVEAVRNRAGTGLCPMEQLSRGVEDPEEMLAKAEEFLAGLAEQA